MSKENKEYTSDWLTSFLHQWNTMLVYLKDGGDVLEVGTYEGRSAVHLLETYPKINLTVVDNFVDPYEEGFEGKFQRNTEEFADRLTVIKADSKDSLPRLVLKRQHFDAIYLDGAHDYDNVKRDLDYCWKLLRPGGILLMDDYNDALRENPFKFGVDQAVHEFFTHRVDFELISNVDTDYQFYVRKLG